VSSWSKKWKQSGPAKADKFVEKLKSDTTGCRLRTKKLGTRKALAQAQCNQAAETFSTTPGYLNASKRLLNTKNPAYREVIQVIGQARQYWRSVTYAYPESGVRLLKKDRVDAFATQMEDFLAKLEAARERLANEWMLVKGEAQEKLGDLFNPLDYPAEIEDEFDLGWEFPNLAAPEFLKSLNPTLYEAEQAKLKAHFTEAIALTELAMHQELQGLVSHLLDRLAPGDDGKPKTLAKTALANFDEFFKRFEETDIGASDELKAVVEQARQAMSGTDVKSLKADAKVRESLTKQIGELKTALEAQIVAKPKRAIAFEDEPNGAESIPAATNEGGAV
jgi:hypothetical protein